MVKDHVTYRGRSIGRKWWVILSASRTRLRKLPCRIWSWLRVQDWPINYTQGKVISSHKVPSFHREKSSVWTVGVCKSRMWKFTFCHRRYTVNKSLLNLTDPKWLDPCNPGHLGCPWWLSIMLPLGKLCRRRLQTAHTVRLHTILPGIIYSSLTLGFLLILTPKLLLTSENCQVSQCCPVIDVPQSLSSPAFLFPIERTILCFTQSQIITHKDMEFICLNNVWMAE